MFEAYITNTALYPLMGIEVGTTVHFPMTTQELQAALAKIGIDGKYEHECRVSKMIDALVDVAAAEKDKASQDFLWGFVREQVEEEATAAGIVDMVKKAGAAGIFFIDAKLGERK